MPRQLSTNVFHEGELSMQRLVGLTEADSSEAGGMVRPFMTRQFQEFFPALPFLVVATVDPTTGRPWASILTLPSTKLKSGLSVARSTDPTTLVLTAPKVAGDPFLNNITGTSPSHDISTAQRMPIGVLGIMLHNRRRNRVNGHVTRITNKNDNFVEIELHVEEAFGNCPKYIQTRSFALEASPPMKTRDVTPSNTVNQFSLNTASSTLSETVKSIISQTDTFFVASSHARTGRLDVSHRGGNPGFLRVLEDNHTIVWPDYKGNNMFQTLGNITSDGVAGITMPSFGSSGTVDAVLYLSGQARVASGKDAEALTPGFPRCVVFTPEEGTLVKRSEVGDDLFPFPFSARFVERSPFNPRIRNAEHDRTRTTARLTPSRRLSPTVQEYSLRTSQPLRVIPGQHIILSLSHVQALADMRDQLSQAMGHVDTFRGNDDLVRVWTVSDGGMNWGQSAGHTAPASPWETDEVQITVKTMPDGLVTNFLQDFAEFGATATAEAKLEVEVLGVAGDFSPFQLNSESRDGSRRSSPTLKYGEIRFAVAGVGITPALSVIRGLRKLQTEITNANPTKLHVMFAASTVDELLWPVLWSDFILPAIPNQVGHQDLTATVVVTREGLSSVKKRLWATMPPGLGLSKDEIDGVVSFSDKIDTGSTGSTITFSASPSSGIDFVSALRLGDEVARVFVCGPGGFTRAVEDSLGNAKATGRISRALDIEKEEFAY